MPGRRLWSGIVDTKFVLVLERGKCRAAMESGCSKFIRKTVALVLQRMCTAERHESNRMAVRCPVSKGAQHVVVALCVFRIYPFFSLGPMAFRLCVCSEYHSAHEEDARKVERGWRCRTPARTSRLSSVPEGLLPLSFKVAQVRRISLEVGNLQMASAA